MKYNPFISFPLYIISLMLIAGCINKNDNETEEKESEYTLGFENITNDTLEVNVSITNLQFQMNISKQVSLSGRFDYKTMSILLKEGLYNITINVDKDRGMMFDIVIKDRHEKYGDSIKIYENRVEFGDKIIK